MHICYLMAETHTASSGGGIASYVLSLAEALLARGHEVTIGAFGDPDASLFPPGLTAIVRRAPNLHWYLYRLLPCAKSLCLPVRQLEWSRAFRGMIEGRRFDLIETTELGHHWLLGHRGAPVVVRSHGSTLGIRRSLGAALTVGDRLNRALELRATRAAAAVSTVSRFMARELSAELGAGSREVAVVGNPLSREMLDRSEATRRPPSGDPIVLYSGRLEDRKGTLPLLASAPLVARQFPRVRYQLAGARHVSITPAALERALSAPGVRERVELLGHQPAPELARLYREATVFVMPSYYETFGISAIEAMAFGLAVVGTTGTALEEIIEEGRTGLLVPPGDASALADAVARLLADPGLRERLGAQARAAVLERYTPERIASSMLGFYEGVLARAGGSRA